MILPVESFVFVFSTLMVVNTLNHSFQGRMHSKFTVDVTVEHKIFKTRCVHLVLKLNVLEDKYSHYEDLLDVLNCIIYMQKHQQQ